MRPTPNGGNRTARTIVALALGGLAAYVSMDPAACEGASRGRNAPNVVLIVADDLGFSDLGCYGSEILTPNIDGLAKEGLRFTQFYNAAHDCSSRAALLTGLYPHQVGIGHGMEDCKLPGYRGNLFQECATIAELFRGAGYQTMMCGKWSVSRHVAPTGPKHAWPLKRGFGKFFGTIHTAGSYFEPVTLCQDNFFIQARGDFYYTDEISKHAATYVEEAARSDRPFFLYVAYTAPHWPLHARADIVARYRADYSGGWDLLRDRRHKKMIEMGLVERRWPLTPRDARVRAWGQVAYHPWHERRMEVYAAQVDSMDRGIGLILEKVKQAGAEQNTLVMFLSDNGGCAEEIAADWQGPHVPQRTRLGRSVQRGNNPNIMPGDRETYQSYGIAWANLSNTPFRLYKRSAHEGGIATPLVVSWPAVIRTRRGITHQVGHVTDVMATCLDVAEIEYPKIHRGFRIPSPAGESLLPVFKGKTRQRGPIFWEHEGNRAMRDGKWKLVGRQGGRWELYDMEADRTEMNDLAEKFAAIAKYMARQWEQWAEQTNVEPWEKVIARKPR